MTLCPTFAKTRYANESHMHSNIWIFGLAADNFTHDTHHRHYHAASRSPTMLAYIYMCVCIHMLCMILLAHVDFNN